MTNSTQFDKDQYQLHEIEKAEFIRTHKRELDNFSPDALPPKELADMRQGWQAKIERAQRGEQRWY